MKEKNPRKRYKQIKISTLLSHEIFNLSFVSYIRGQYIGHTLHVYKYIVVSLTWPSRQLSLYGWRHPGAREAQSTKDTPIQLIILIINSLLR